MKHQRVVVTRHGGPEVLQVVEEDRPEPRAGEVRVRVLAAGVSLPDVMMREGIHPENPRLPFTPGWDLVGVVDAIGPGAAAGLRGQRVIALPITGAYAEYVCLPQGEAIPLPDGVDAAEATSLALNYVTAYQMLHRAARVRAGQAVLVHGASGGVGTALLQLAALAGLQVYATCSPEGAAAVAAQGGTPIDYRQQDFVAAVRRLAPEGVDVVFDSIGGAHIWQSRRALRPGGKVVAYGLTGALQGGRIRGARPHRLRGLAIYGACIAASRLLPGHRYVVPYSIQWLKRRRPDLFRQDLATLLALLRDGRIHPIVARRFPIADARLAQQLLGEGHVIGKIVLVGREVPALPGADRTGAQAQSPATS